MNAVQLKWIHGGWVGENRFSAGLELVRTGYNRFPAGLEPVRTGFQLGWNWFEPVFNMRLELVRTGSTVCTVQAEFTERRRGTMY